MHPDDPESYQVALSFFLSIYTELGQKSEVRGQRSEVKGYNSELLTINN